MKLHSNQSLTIDVSNHSEVGVWCSLPAAISTEPVVERAPRLHVHVRNEIAGKKHVDSDFEFLEIVTPEQKYELTPETAYYNIQQGLIPRTATITPNRTLNLDEYADCEYTLWASTPALLWTSKRPQEQGIHVHIQRNGKYIVDDTFGVVTLRGKELNRLDLLSLMLERVKEMAC